jgi:hypothetical protein
MKDVLSQDPDGVTSPLPVHGRVGSMRVVCRRDSSSSQP